MMAKFITLLTAAFLFGIINAFSLVARPKTLIKARRFVFGRYPVQTKTTTPLSSHRQDTALTASVEQLNELILSMEEASSSEKASAQVSFSHVHLYVDKLQELKMYKDLEDRLNQLAAAKGHDGKVSSLPHQRALWQQLSPRHATHEDMFCPQNRDVVQQLLAGLGFRVTGYYDDGMTRTVLVTSRDPRGVQIVASTMLNSAGHSGSEGSQYAHFDAAKLQQFYNSHQGRPGIAVLAFTVDNVDAIHANYQDKHARLIADYQTYHDGKLLEVYAYYTGEKDVLLPDVGTVLRFVQGTPACGCLPGLQPVRATFDDTSMPAYCDHWVSNVHSRTQFLATLHDTLGFTPKVDFNAGVVAAGEAQIESTVTGNTSPLATTDAATILRDQSQVYLPINNALSEVGHVHGFLQELGQGVQHVASRVPNLVQFVQRGNDWRKMTGEGFSFLNIPRSYYGVLTADDMVKAAGILHECATAIASCLEQHGVLGLDAAVDLGATRDSVDNVLSQYLDQIWQNQYKTHKNEVLTAILQSRYKNLLLLLGEHCAEDKYMGIVRNQILVDIQGDDLLLQIFTSNILQRQTGDEAPFFEFIERVCSECREDDGCPRPIKPGCGGFGIRNFLTLFLSIEVSKAMQEVAAARAEGDEARHNYAEAMVQGFTAQLNESNPILTDIAESMTDEGHYKEQLLQARNRRRGNDAGHKDDIERLQSLLTAASKRKAEGNQRLMECSARYNILMRNIREQRVAAVGAEPSLPPQ